MIGSLPLAACKRLSMGQPSDHVNRQQIRSGPRDSSVDPLPKKHRGIVFKRLCLSFLMFLLSIEKD